MTRGKRRAHTWIPLVAGYGVVLSDDHETISVEYEPPAGPQ
jgi:hypothetical protein